MKKVLNILFNRLTVIIVLLLIQLGVLTATIWTLSHRFVYVYGAFVALSIVMVFVILNSESNPAVKLSWTILVTLVPVFGGLFYLYFGKTTIPRKSRLHSAAIAEKIAAVFPDNSEVLTELEAADPHAASHCKYITAHTSIPVFKNTDTVYFPCGEDKFEALKRELEQAEHYIFMEYFIIEEGIMWNAILDILKRKAAAGVDVRLLYDDAGCISTLPYKYDRTLEAAGIRCEVFNPFKPALVSVLQNRDHRKIAVIDGHTAFTGGVNLADEYINAIEKHGHWKDCAVMLKGEAVLGFTAMFLQIWNFYRSTDTDYAKFLPSVHARTPFTGEGFVAPYGDTPFDNEYVSESVYLNTINNATRYLYIDTPYLIVDNEMITALSLAAKRGVDVRIVTPHIADKWYVHIETRSYYKPLLKAGVLIYEYTPGFIHSKTFVSDDNTATVGTVNLDYRSLYHHFECGAWMYRTRAVGQVKEDFLKTLEVCQTVTLEDCAKIPWGKRCLAGIMKIVAPLM